MHKSRLSAKDFPKHTRREKAPDNEWLLEVAGKPRMQIQLEERRKP
jgi:hypothetical protein